MYPFSPGTGVKLISIVVILFCITHVSAQNTPTSNPRPPAAPPALPASYYNNTGNYIRTWEPSIPTSDPAVVSDPARTVNEVRLSTQYFDG
ncbi:hypothetical protein [Chitinophaga sp. RAB17]|uniref:hypothetical protein n=1 Tax=Chitinophaga sp. RAB17 TaxID=3233049 RepID=UPI003F8F08AC